MNTSTYYIDPAAGDDANDGRSPDRPLRSYAEREFGGGDTVLFRRGSVIRDMLHTCNGEQGAPITYGAYWEGDPPAFLGSVPVGDPGLWVEAAPSVWRYTGSLASEVCNLIFDDGAACGILRWQPEDLRQPGDWHYTTIGMSSGAESWGAGGARAGVLYLCASANPGLIWRTIEAALWGERRLVGGQRHVVLENLSFRNAGVHGYQEYHARDIVIRGCDFRFIGGAVWHRERRIRFGNGIEFWDGASDIVVESCLFDNIYDAAVTHQGGGTLNIPERLCFRNNLFRSCGLAAYECREPSRDVVFERNTCIDGGGGFSMQGEIPPRRLDPYPQPVGYHVFIWMIDAGTQPGRVFIRDNVFCESYGAAISAILDPADEHQFMVTANDARQSAGVLRTQLSRLEPGTAWREALALMVAEGRLPIRIASSAAGDGRGAGGAA